MYKSKLTAAICFCLCAGLLCRADSSLTTSQTVLGTTPQYVGFSQGDFVSNTNVSAWVDYSGANAFRIWSSPGSFPTEVSPAPTITTQTQFDARKAALRADPNSNTYINWPTLNTDFSSNIKVGSNQVVLNYALGQLNARNIHVVEEISRTISSEVTDWQGKWEQWQEFYAQAFYEAKNFNVSQFQIYNEPDLSSGETASDLLVRLQLASDAIHSAIADVDKLYGKSLVASVAGPTTAGSSSTTFNSWGKTLLAGNRTDYEGNPTTYDLFNTYDVHIYSSSPSTFATNIGFLKSNIAANNASGNSMPVILTEFNYETTATYANNGDTISSPKIVSGIGADLIGATSANVDGLYGFKFNQTPYASASQGTIPQPTGFYYLDSGNTDNVTGSTLGAEAYRLFAKGFKGARNRLSTSGSLASGFSMATSVDSTTNTYYAYASNTSTSANPITLDLSGWNVQPGALVTIEEANSRYWGEVSQILTVSANKKITYTQPAQSVDLITVPQLANQTMVSIPVTADGQVRYNPSVANSKTTNYNGGTTSQVSRSSTGDNFATYLKFNLTNQNQAAISRAILEVTGDNSSSAVETFEVYGILNTNWTESNLTWAAAPDLSQTSATLTNVGTDAFPVGHFSFNASQSVGMMDVTPFVQEFGSANITFALVREQQFAGEADDGNTVSLFTRESGANAPQLVLFTTQTPEPMIGLLACVGAISLCRRRRNTN